MKTFVRRSADEPEPDGRPVLATAPLRPGHRRERLSRYGDTDWDLGPAVFRENARRCHVTVHFTAIEDPQIADALRAYLYVRLNFAIPGRRLPLRPANVRQAFNRARRFFDFVKQERGSFGMQFVDQALIDRYVKTLRNHGTRAVIVVNLVDVVFDLYVYRHYLGDYALTFEPWSGRSAADVAGYRVIRRENRTPRIPESVISPLVTWSIKYVTLFAKDIIAAREELTALNERMQRFVARDAALNTQEKKARYQARLKAFFERRRRQGRGVPLWTRAHNGLTRRDPISGLETPPINALLLHQWVGIDARTTPEFHLLVGGCAALIDDAITEYGTEIGGMDTPITIDPDSGRSWRPRFDAKAVAFEERMLQAACYVLCAYLTGMRDCEVQAMRSGCLRLSRSEDGLVERHRVRSTVYKARAAKGEPAEWVTIAPVAQAIHVLERLADRAAKATGTNTLWPVLAYERSTKTHISAEIVRQLNIYRDHLNALFGSDAAPAIPHGPDGRPWRLTTRQFRRTIAWHIANRPFGTVAGMIQYKHASVAAFEGYAGSSRSGFRAEIETQRALGQIEDILEYFDVRQAGAEPSGPAGPRIARALDAVSEGYGDLSAKLADRGRLRTMLADLARSLHVGILADCFFDPSTALCLKNTNREDTSTPLVALCEPARCPNACIRERHLPAWRRSAEEAKALLREKRLPALQRIALTQDLKRVEAIIKQTISSEATQK